ncbi:hypothetical protein [Streptomyces sp. NPDC053431]|uniref:hypothetical protein n=1 Tax=Streptomyces sp. NPDC053431 TaxID=3365703 RepID=UPI0037CE4F40
MARNDITPDHDDEAGPLPEGKRVWPRNAALAVLAAGATFLALKFTGAMPEDESMPSASADRPATATAPATSPTTTAGASAPTPAPTRAPAAAAAGTAPMVPLAEVFPARVPDGKGGAYTRVGSAVLASCKEPDTTGPRLAALIDEGKGCVGEQVALYKDAANNQYNIAVFTMKDPLDTVHLVTTLSLAYDDYQVAAQAPPPGSGLATLPPTSGMVQVFSGVGRAMVVGLGQWSDGRTADFQQLVDRLSPLRNAIGDKAAAYETSLSTHHS